MKKIIGLILCLVILYFLNPFEKKSKPININECLKFISTKPYKHREEIRTGYELKPINIITKNGVEFKLTLNKQNLNVLGITPIGNIKMKREDKLILHLEEDNRIVYERSFSSKSKGYYISLPVHRGIGLKGKKENYKKLENFGIQKIEIKQSANQIMIDLKNEDSELLRKSFRCLAKLGE